MSDLGATLLAQGLMPVSEVARRLGYSRDTIWRWAREGIVESRKIGSAGNGREAVYIKVDSICAKVGNDIFNQSFADVAGMAPVEE